MLGPLGAPILLLQAGPQAPLGLRWGSCSLGLSLRALTRWSSEVWKVLSWPWLPRSLEVLKPSCMAFMAANSAGRLVRQGSHKEGAVLEGCEATRASKWGGSRLGFR